MLVGKLKNGECDFEPITGRRRFETCGVMLDCSRNAVIKPSAFRDFLCKVACMGLDMVMLYMEDVYEIEEYPYFGYMRGAYTREEIKEMDACAAALGIELIPCIQTLAHLTIAMRWPLADGEHLVAPRPGTGQAHEVAGAVLLDEGAALLPGAGAETGFTGAATHPLTAPETITVNGRPCRVKVW